MKEQFIEKRFNSQNAALIEQCAWIVEKYQEMSLRLTLRQLYYQFVSHDLFPDDHKWVMTESGRWVRDPEGTKNAEPNYKWLSSVLSDARLAGLIDWSAIEDRIRVPRTPNEFESIQQLVDVALASYRLPRWRGQDYYVELWVEKDALAGVLRPIAHSFHITMMVNRGYSSQSAMYDSAERFKNAEAGHGAILYLGDHDPSGEDMVRDIRDRLQIFEADVEVRKIALTHEQIEKYNPPPNPAKISDPRAAAYIEKFGNTSWEVDALPPEDLTELITDGIKEFMDMAMMGKIINQEKADKRKLERLIEKGFKS